MKLNFTNIKGDKATIECYGHIGYDESLGWGVNGSYFSNEMRWINENYPDLKEIEVLINSQGGSVQDGLMICTSILDSKIPVTTVGVGFCYSMGGVILMCGNKRKMRDYATFMMHNAQGGNDEDVLNLISNSLATIFERCSSLTIDSVKSLMAKESWMSPDECKGMGFIDEVVKTNNKKPNTKNILELTNYYNQLLNKKPMIKVTNLLKLNNDASEDAIVESISKIETDKASLASKVTDLEKELSEAKVKLSAFEDAEKAKENEAKVAVIENAIKEKKADASKKDFFVNSTMSAAELTDLFGAIKAPYTPVINSTTTVGAAGNGEDRSKWTLTDWSKKDPKGLSEMRANDAASFDALVNKMPSELSNNYNPLTDKKF